MVRAAMRKAYLSDILSEQPLKIEVRPTTTRMEVDQRQIVRGIYRSSKPLIPDLGDGETE